MGNLSLLQKTKPPESQLTEGYDWNLLYIYNDKILVVSQNGFPVGFDTGLDADNLIAQ